MNVSFASTAGQKEPLVLDEVKTILHVGDDEDVTIGGLIVAARRYFEEESGWALIRRTVTGRTPYWPRSRALVLPYPPLVSVSSVAYATSTGSSTWSSSNYYVDIVSTPGRVQLLPTSSWPTTALYPPGVTVTYVAGFGAEPYSVPEDIRLALTQLVAHWFENRESVYVPDARRAGAPTVVPMSAERVIQYYKEQLF